MDDAIMTGLNFPVLPVGGNVPTNPFSAGTNPGDASRAGATNGDTTENTTGSFSNAFSAAETADAPAATVEEAPQFEPLIVYGSGGQFTATTATDETTTGLNRGFEFTSPDLSVGLNLGGTQTETVVSAAAEPEASPESLSALLQRSSPETLVGDPVELSTVQPEGTADLPNAVADTSGTASDIGVSRNPEAIISDPIDLGDTPIPETVVSAPTPKPLSEDANKPGSEGASNTGGIADASLTDTTIDTSQNPGSPEETFPGTDATTPEEPDPLAPNRPTEPLGRPDIINVTGGDNAIDTYDPFAAPTPANAPSLETTIAEASSAVKETSRSTETVATVATPATAETERSRSKSKAYSASQAPWSIDRQGPVSAGDEMISKKSPLAEAPKIFIPPGSDLGNPLEKAGGALQTPISADQSITAPTASATATLLGSASRESLVTPTAAAVQEAAAKESLVHVDDEAEIGNRIGVEVARQAKAGRSRITIRLDPPEMGRIDVRMALGDDGSVRALVAAEKEETLSLLQRDQRILERTLQDAGLKADSGSLNFSLKQQANQQGNGNSALAGRSNVSGSGMSDPLTDANADAIPEPPKLYATRALDLRI
ncbi:MAG: flagellar hook-length control protein FliK [Pseudomonadota bacterium]